MKLDLSKIPKDLQEAFGLSRGVGRPPKQAPLMPKLASALFMLIGRTLNKGEPTPSEAIGKDLKELKALSSTLLLCLSAGVVTVSYYGIVMGISETGDGILQKGLALVVAMVLGVVNWLGYHHAFSLLDRLSKKRLGKGAVISFVFLALMSAIDAQLITQAIGGGVASQMSLADTVASYEDRFASISDKLGAVQKVLPAINTDADRFAEVKQNELDFGGVSGKSGPGQVSVALGQVETTLRGLSRELTDGLAEATSIEGEITASLGRMKEQLYAKTPIAGRLEVTSKEAGTIDGLFARLDRYDYRASVEASLHTLANLFPTETATARSEFEAVQNEKIGVIREMAKPVAQGLTDALASLSTNAGDDGFERVRPMTPGDAVKHYWLRILPEWLLAIALDLAPGLLLGLLIQARQELEERALTEKELSK